MSSSPNNCHYYELGSYITVCKPGLDLRRKEAGLGTIVSHIGTALLSSRRYANRSPKWYLGVCLRVMGRGRVWTGIRCQASRKSQFVRGVPDDILKRDRSLSFTWRAPSGSHRWRHQRRILTSPLLSSSCSLSGWCPSVRVSGMAEVPCTTTTPSTTTAEHG